MRHPSLDRALRRGYGLVEVAISCLILAAALSLSLVGLSRIATERKAIEYRHRADQEAVNALERFLALPWSTRTADTAKSFALDESAMKRLPNAKLKLDVTEVAGPPAGRKVVVSVTWGASDKTIPAEAPVKLSAWTYPTEGEAK